MNDKFKKWLQDKYGEHGKVKAHCGAKHDYLGMALDYSEKGKIIVGMSDYIKDMLEEFPTKFKDKEKVATPAADHLFKAGKGRRLDCNWVETFQYDCSKRTVCIKASMTGYTSDDCVIMYVSERPQRI